MLDHPNIVRVYDAGELGPLGYFIASEYCEGPSLRLWLKSQNQPVPARLAARWLAAVADAVQHAHERGILHRDIKPDNIILTGGPEAEDRVPRLTDFGLAKLVEEAGDETRSEARIGTPHYMAPEQAAGRRREVGPAADIYALGATLYEILTGRPPFRGETDAETLRLVLEAEPVALRSVRPGLPRDLETICLRCLRKEPARRYASAGALRDDLRSVPRRTADRRPAGLGRRARTDLGPAQAGDRRPDGAGRPAGWRTCSAASPGGPVGWDGTAGSSRSRSPAVTPEAREAEKQKQIAEERRHQADRHHYAGSLRRVRRALDARQFELAQDILHDIRPEPDGYDPRGFAWRYLWRQAHREFSQLWGHEATVVCLAVSRDGRTLATGDLQGKALLWDISPDMRLDKPRELPITPHAVWGFRRVFARWPLPRHARPRTPERPHRSLRGGHEPASATGRSRGRRVASCAVLRLQQPAPGRRAQSARRAAVRRCVGRRRRIHAATAPDHRKRLCVLHGILGRRRTPGRHSKAGGPGSMIPGRARYSPSWRVVEPGPDGLPSFSADGRFFAAHLARSSHRDLGDDQRPPGGSIRGGRTESSSSSSAREDRAWPSWMARVG